MVSCHNFIYEAWRSKEVGRGEVLMGGGDQILSGELTPLDTMCLSTTLYFPLKHNKSFQI